MSSWSSFPANSKNSRSIFRYILHRHSQMLLWVRAGSGNAALTNGLATYIRRQDCFALPVDRKLEPALPVTLLHHEEQGGMGAEVDKEADRKGSGAGSEG